MPESNTDADAYAKKLISRHAAVEALQNEITISNNGIASVFVDNELGGTDRIDIIADPGDQHMTVVNPDKKDPVSFKSDTITIRFRRYRISQAEQPKMPEEIRFAWDEVSSDDNPEHEQEEDTSFTWDAIIHDLIKKLHDPEMTEDHLIHTLRRILVQTGFPQRWSARIKADKIMPYYRRAEIQRLLTDPADPDIDHFTMLKRRQNLYNQLNGYLRDAGMDPSNITEYMMNGVLDRHSIAGVPIFTDKHRQHFIAVDYAFSGYDELNPVGTDFSGGYEERSIADLDRILDAAARHGYETLYYNEYVDGGVDRKWSWTGIRIDGYDDTDPESNLKKVIKILKDVGIDPIEAADTNYNDIEDLFFHQ